ncbi:MAG: RagB/SusD family nutrient uptake outer membrane protein [Chitinophagaceae bacterium]|nr:MAG: RagB/SusD family nutrient uptake outer membrane protein [Chitinophagaceae bacterium]
MKQQNIFKLSIVLLSMALLPACTKLDKKIYSVVPNQNFWQTPAQIAAGIAPAYANLSQIPAGEYQNLMEHSADGQLTPARGADWLAAGQHIEMWTHTWHAETEAVVNTWPDLYRGISNINFILSVVNSLDPIPPDLANINAELKTLRALYYYWAMDLYGNVPLVTDFNTDPTTITNSTRKQVYDFVEKEIKDNINLVTSTTGLTTYGRVTKYLSFTILAKLYLNSEIYVNQPRWAEARDMCDSVILSNKYSLMTNYYDNFSQNNESSTENIFAVPFDNVNIGGNNIQTQTLHYDNEPNTGIRGGGWNGYCSNAEFYSNFDTTSVYAKRGQNTYRTFLDSRSGQYLVGQQFNERMSYPPSTNVLVASDNAALRLTDKQTGKLLSFYPNVKEVNNPTDTFRLAGVRSVKFFPNAGVQTSMSNDFPLYRLADVLLMRAEASMRNGTATGTDLNYVNMVRTRAYGGDASKNWTMPQLTLVNMLAERARELAWEDHRRTDVIRFGTFGNARVPAKAQDADRHFEIFPIPKAEYLTNPNLKQNPGYPPF